MDDLKCHSSIFCLLYLNKNIISDTIYFWNPSGCNLRMPRHPPIAKRGFKAQKSYYYYYLILYLFDNDLPAEHIDPLVLSLFHLRSLPNHS